MTRSIHQFNVRDEEGLIIPSAEVNVDLSSGGEADIYQDANGGIPLTQPILSNASGRVEFYIEPGVYNVTAKSPISPFPSYTNEFVEIGVTREKINDSNFSQPLETSSITTLDIINESFEASVNDVITTSGYTSPGDGGASSWQFNGVTGQTPSQSVFDTGGRWITDADGNRWDLVLGGDGSFNELQVGGFVAAAKTLSEGGFLRVLKNVALEQGVIQSCLGNVKIKCAEDVTFTALPGFLAAELLEFGGAGTTQKFEWYGGFLKGKNVPLSGSGEANDLLSVANFNEIYISKVDADCETESDSCIFTANYDYCVITSCKLRNAPDAGIYTSGPSTDESKGTCYLAFNYAENCLTSGYTAKRRVKNFIASDNEAVNCSTGITTAEANGIAPAENISWSNNSFSRCTTSMIARQVIAGSITGNTISELGQDGGVTAGSGIAIQGGSNLSVTGNTIKGWNADNGLSAASFRGYLVTSREFGGNTFYSTKNSIVGGAVSNIGKVVLEEGTLNSGNVYSNIIPENISGSNYTIGSDTSLAIGVDVTGVLWEVATKDGRKLAVQDTTTENYIYLNIAARQGGAAVIKRVKQGAAGTGPGGVGRALYVDN